MNQSRPEIESTAKVKVLNVMKKENKPKMNTENLRSRARINHR